MACSWCRKEGHVISECAPEARVTHIVRMAHKKVRHALETLTDTQAMIHPSFAEDIADQIDGLLKQVDEFQAVLRAAEEA